VTTSDNSPIKFALIETPSATSKSKIMACIFCGSTHALNTVEHIVPESLGNKSYALEKGKICADCNNGFSKFEDIAQSKSILGYERARLAVMTKKGKPGRGKTGHLEFIGSEDFKKNYIRAAGLK
jgi:hypothetical protein